MPVSSSPEAACILIRYEEVHTIALLVPGGFLDAVNRMNAPAERMEIPTDHDTVTYANGDLRLSCLSSMEDDF
jgi:hypothetical protein